MAQTCYRHTDRETAVSCSRCGRPICPDCMTPSPVGMRCPECAGERTQVRSGRAAISSAAAAYGTFALIALNVAAFLAELAGGGGAGFQGGGTLITDGGIFGPAIADGEYYRIITGGFLHAGVIHIAFNMLALYVLGTLLEPAIGTLRFVAIYLAALVGGSFGALLFDPNTVTVGASGAVFGIFAATFLVARGRGLDGIASQIGFWLIINLVLTFSVSGISIGGHLGGMVVGALAGLIVVAGERGRLGKRHQALELAAISALGVGCFVLSIAIA